MANVMIQYAQERWRALGLESKALWYTHRPSLCAQAIGEAVGKVVMLEAQHLPSEHVTARCSCECRRCARGWCEELGMSLDAERVAIRARMAAHNA